ncbi:hypothetical protein ACYBSK_04195 [Streptomyces sp. BYX5S]
MPLLLIRQKFTDYTQWRKAFDSLDAQRATLGLETVTVTRNMDDPHEAVVLFRFQNIDRLRQHFPSPALEEAWRRGGVMEGSNQVTFLREED